MNINSLSLATALFLAPISITTLGGSHNQIITISADRAQISVAKNTAIYTGNVIIKQANLVLSGQKALLQRNKAGALSLFRCEGDGVKFAHFQQKSTDPHATIHGWAKQIKYRPVEKMVYFLGHARATQKGNSFSGDIIAYNIKSQEVVATTNHKAGKKRVEAIIQPKSAK